MADTSLTAAPRTYARVLLARVTDPAARTLAQRAGPIGGIMSCMEPYARGGLALFVVEFRTGAREVFRSSEVEVVRCGCGCGSPVPLAPRTVTRRGWTRGEPIPYLPNHGKRLRLLVDPNPTGHCQCGCGAATQIATRGWSGQQMAIGAHYRYVQGHQMRGRHHPPTLTCRKGHPRTGRFRRNRGRIDPLCEVCRAAQLARYAAKQKTLVVAQGRAEHG